MMTMVMMVMMRPGPMALVRSMLVIEMLASVVDAVIHIKVSRLSKPQ